MKMKDEIRKHLEEMEAGIAKCINHACDEFSASIPYEASNTATAITDMVDAYFKVIDALRRIN